MRLIKSKEKRKEISIDELVPLYASQPKFIAGNLKDGSVAILTRVEYEIGNYKLYRFDDSDFTEGNSYDAVDSPDLETALLQMFEVCDDIHVFERFMDFLDWLQNSEYDG